MDIRLEDYCCICGKKIDCLGRQIGLRGKNGDVPANICDTCNHVNSWFLHWSPSKCLRFVVTSPSKLFRRFDKGYYICAKPIGLAEEDWQDVDRCWIEVERVYETRWDCSIKPERVRQAA